MFHQISHRFRTLRPLTGATLITLAVSLPLSAQAGPIENIEKRVDQTHQQVKKINKNVTDIVKDMEKQQERLRKAGLEELKDTILSVLTFIRHSKAGYQSFVDPDNCGGKSQCGAFRDKLHDAILDFAELPETLPFVEEVPASVEQLYETAHVVDFIPPPVLYASAKALESNLDEVQAVVEMLRSAAERMPPLPTKSELKDAASNTSSAVLDQACAIDPNNPHIQLALTLLDIVGGSLNDMAGMVQEEISAAIVGEGTGVKNPLKLALQLMAFVPNTAKRSLKGQLAVIASVCAIR